jgi:hypothetical protein
MRGIFASEFRERGMSKGSDPVRIAARPSANAIALAATLNGVHIAVGKRLGVCTSTRMIRAALRSPLLRKPLHQIEAYRARNEHGQNRN